MGSLSDISARKRLFLSRKRSRDICILSVDQRYKSDVIMRYEKKIPRLFPNWRGSGDLSFMDGSYRMGRSLEQSENRG